MWIFVLCLVGLVSAGNWDIKKTPYVSFFAAPSFAIEEANPSLLGEIEGGLQYGNSYWGGAVLARSSGSIGEGVEGAILEAGTKIGLRGETWGAYLGLLLNVSDYSSMDSTLGAEIPLTLTFGPGPFYLFAEGAPYLNLDRPMEWDVRAGAGFRRNNFGYELRAVTHFFEHVTTVSPGISVSWYNL